MAQMIPFLTHINLMDDAAWRSYLAKLEAAPDFPGRAEHIEWARIFAAPRNSSADGSDTVSGPIST